MPILQKFYRRGQRRSGHNHRMLKMKNWYDRAIKSAIEQTNVTGESNNLNRDLNRILEQIEYLEMPLYRSEITDQIIDRIEDAYSIPDLISVLDLICERLDFHCIAIFFPGLEDQNIGVKVATNYPDAWVAEYIKNNYAGIDPVVAASLELDCFYWDDLGECDHLGSEVLRRALKHNVGPVGFTFTTRVLSGIRVSASVCGHVDTEAEFRESIDFHLDDLMHISRRFGARMMFLFDRTGNFRSLNSEAIEILYDIAAGVDPNELSMRRVAFGNFGQVADAICDTLGCRTVYQAAVIAERLGLLREPRLRRSEVISRKTGSSNAEPKSVNGKAGCLSELKFFANWNFPPNDNE